MIIEPILLENLPTYSSFSLCAGVNGHFHDQGKIRSDELLGRKVGVDLVEGNRDSGMVRQHSQFPAAAKDRTRQPHSRLISRLGEGG